MSEMHIGNSELAMAGLNTVFDRSIAKWNHEWVNRDAIRLSIFDPGLTSGVSVVERFRTVNNKAYSAKNYLRRFVTNCGELSIRHPLIDDSELQSALDELLDRNRETLIAQRDVSIVLYATPGMRSPNSEPPVPTLVMYLDSLPWERLQTSFRIGMNLAVTDFKLPSSSWPIQVKTRCRLHYYLADQFAKSSNAEFGILRTTDGTLADTSIANLIFVTQEQGLITPKPTAVFFGQTISRTLELSAACGLPIRTGRVSPSELADCTEVLMTGSSGFLCPVRKIDSQEFAGVNGTCYQELSHAWTDALKFDYRAQALSS